jgi:hypothetical protein
MAVVRTRVLILVTAVAAAAALFAAPGWCVELRLAGVAIGDTPEEVLASPSFGTPDGVFSPDNVFNSAKAALGETPPWAVAVKMAQLAPEQVEWVYDRSPVSVGIVITGEGINAHVTDITVSMWLNFDPSKLAQTAKGVQLGTSFADVLQRYGWPNRIQIIAEAGQMEAAAGGTARPAALGRLGGLGVPRPSAATSPAALALPRPTVGSWGVRPRPTAPGGGFRLALGRRLGAQGAGVQPLPSVGPGIRVPGAAAAAGPANTAIAAVGQTPNVTFTKSCIISYPSVDFVIYRMKVFRIHVYGR